MSVVIFAMNSSMSHYFASFGIASHLKRQGYSILYFSATMEGAQEEINKYRKLVEARGFAFVEMDIDNIIRRKKNDFLRRKNVFVFNTDAFEELINTYQPGLIFLDAFLSEYAILLYKYQLPLIMLQTMVCLNKAPFVPPINSHLIPFKRDMATYLRVEWEWFVFFFKRFFTELIGKIWLLGSDIGSQLKRAGRNGGLDFAEVYRKRPFTIGFKKYPEIILPARALDFKRPPLPENYHYAGPLVDLERNDGGNQKFDELIATWHSGNYNKLVYCSLGTMAPEHNVHCLDFFKKVIAIFSSQPQHMLVLSVGHLIDVTVFTDLPVNVHVFNTLPQIQILKSAHLMLTAAGINSISECVLSGVPMIVFPLNANFDQNGNAARVVYHGLGERASITDSIDELAAKIKRVEESEDIYSNVKKMQATLINENASAASMQVVERLVENNKKKNYHQQQLLEVQ